jgi:hypothetical protein
MDPSVRRSLLEVLAKAESIDLLFGKLEGFEGQPKFHLLSLSDSLSLSSSSSSSLPPAWEDLRYIFILRTSLYWSLPTKARQPFWNIEFLLKKYLI